MDKKEKYGIVYKITNTKTNQSYIGATTDKRGFNGRYARKGTGIERVLAFHEYQKEKGRDTFNEKLYNAIKKYGIESFTVEEEFDIAYSKEELRNKEATYIIQFDCIKNGYNTKDEFTHDVYGNLSEEKQENIRKILREKNLGEKNPMYGKRQSEEAKRKLSEKLSGENNPMYGRERLDVRGDLNPMRRPEVAKKLTGRGNGASRSVICTTTQMPFDTVKEAAEYYNCSSTHIPAVCKHKPDRKTCGSLPDGTKLKWEYFDKYVEIENLHYVLSNIKKE